MIWIIASLPLWIAGAFLLIVGMMGVGKVISSSEDRAWKSVSNGEAIIVGGCFVLASAPLLYLAAKVAS